jgi:hypothetical protein
MQFDFKNTVKNISGILYFRKRCDEVAESCVKRQLNGINSKS